MLPAAKPKPALLCTVTTPALTVVTPAKVLSPERFKTPGFDLTMLPLEMTAGTFIVTPKSMAKVRAAPPRERLPLIIEVVPLVLPFTVPPRVNVPVPVLMLPPPENVKVPRTDNDPFAVLMLPPEMVVMTPEPMESENPFRFSEPELVTVTALLSGI